LYLALKKVRGRADKPADEADFERIRRELIVPPVGLADNWESEQGARYRLYLVYDCAATPRLLRIQNPYHTLAASLFETAGPVGSFGVAAALTRSHPLWYLCPIGEEHPFEFR
jgi:hypothetical protein